MTNAAIQIEETPELVEQRQAANDRRYRYRAFYLDLKNFAVQVSCSEEGAKTLLKRFRASLDNLNAVCSAFTDTNDNRQTITATVADVQQRMNDLLLLDPRLDWLASIIRSRCVSFANLLQEPLQAQPLQADEPPTPNAKRVAILNEIDELHARLSSLGDPENGGLEERRPAIAKAHALRLEISSDLTTEIGDPAKIVQMAREIQEAVQSLLPLRSKVTGEPGFMQRGMPAIHAQIDKITQMLDRELARPHRALIPIVSPGKTRERN